MEITFYPLTNAQKRIWYTEKFYPNTSISNLAGFGKLISEDGVQAHIVEKAIQEFVRRHESMRIRLRLDDEGEPVQYVSEYHPLTIEHTDIRQAGCSAEELSKWGRDEASKPLALYDQDLFRFSVYTISENEVWFYVNVHHVISDGISMTILGNTITDIYLELSGGASENEAEIPSFIEHVLTEQEYVQSKRFKKDRDFWNGQFETVPELVSLKRSQADAGLDAKRFSQEIPHDLYGRIQSFCGEHKVSVLSLFQSALIAYLYKVTGRDDVVTGTFMGNRTNAKEKQMLGMFVSTVPVRTSVDGSQPFLEFVKGRMKDLMKILRHQKYPYNLLVNDLRASKSSLSRLFTVALEYQVMQWQKKENLSFLTDPIFSGSGTNDISIHVKERWDTGKLTIDFDYRSDIFKADEIASVSERLITLIEDAISSPDRVIDELALLSESEKELLLKRASGNPVAYRKEMTIPALFEEKAKALTDKPAVVYEGRTLSYRTLHEQSGRIAGRLLKAGISADSPVAVLLGRSDRVIAAILGILKAGGAYVPIDPDFPADRIQYILEDSGAKAVLTEAGIQAPETNAEQIDFDEAVQYETAADGVCTQSDRLAYIIYTSGTTGRPKGVMIEHRQVHHLVQSLQQEIYQCGEQTLRMALLAPFHFDASVKQIFASLLLGQTLYIVPKTTVTNGSALLDYYRQNRIEATDGTPAHLQMMVATGDVSGIELRHMLIGGEGLSAAVAEQLMTLFHQSGKAPRLTNVYGPTETCVDASVYEVSQDNGMNQQAAYVPIGKPLGNARLYILDKHKRLQPDGTAGELYIAGDGVGRGYLNLPDLTAEKFLQDPFNESGRMYRTGDMARWLPDGTIEYIGREDDQVKVRGYRIELGEIETVLRKAPGAAEAVVLARPDQQGSLDVCAYIVQEKGTEFHPAEYREYVSKHLPDYMVPAYFTKTDKIPLTPSGKADRKKLFALDVQAVSSSEYAAPRNETEKTLAVIWQEVLGMDKAGIYDHFFESGGHSLKAMTLLTKIHKQMGVEIPLQYLFEHPTIAALADYAVSRNEGPDYSAIKPAEKQESYPLSLAQQRIYIASQFEDAGVGYNMPAAAVIEGALDREKLERAFSVLISRHEALRTSFQSEDGTPRQVIHEHVPFHIEMIEASGRTNEQVMKDFVRRFELAEAPLFRIGLQTLGHNRHMLLFDMHHLISDGVSISIMLKELAEIYSGKQLPDLHIQYKDYAVWQAERAEEGYKKERAYWKEVFSGELPVLQLLPDYPRPQVQSFEGDRVSVKLPKELRDRLQKLAGKNGATLYMVLLSAYYTLLSKYSGQEDIIVGTPSAGRNHSDTEGLIGMFVNTLALRSSVKQDQTFTDLLGHVRKQVLDAFSHQDYPFEWLTEELNVPRDMSRHPIFDTMFSLQNASNGIPEIGNLTLSLHETNFNIAKFDLTMQARETAEGIALDLDYCTKLFKRSTADRLLAHYVRLLESAAAQPDAKIREYDLLSEREALNQLQRFNPERTVYPKEQTIVQIFEEQARKNPDRTALQFEGETLSYQQLNERANRLARHILSVGGGGKTAAVLCERSMDMIVSIMAVLKAGSAYVPIDPEHPVQRIQHFFRDSGANVLLTQQSLKPLAEKAGFQGVIVLADDEASYEKDSHNPALPFDSKTIANLTYTSGTTGTPKGNIVTHANILRTVKNTNYLTVSEEDTVLGLSNYVFDAFMFDMFGSLLNGAKLVIVPKDTVLDMTRLSRVIKRENVSILMITTALFHLLVDMEPSCLTTLRKIMFGGERASVEHVKKALAAVGKGKLLHMYGPSESTVFATYHPVDVIEEDTLSVPIGKPVSNTEIFIMNTAGRMQPAGIPGELCVSGEGLVEGYYNRPELTEEKFVKHPFKEGERMYKTGDLARWLPNGDIEFIGRIDHQVKIRGQRIELGEIEHQIQSHDQIQECIVLAVDQGAGDKLLCAYFVGLREISSRELREHTAKDLPAYMIPAVFIQMDELPLTGNGKIDRRALPMPDVTAANAVSYTAPSNETEQKLADIWAEVLQMERVGVHDQFFEIGGHSLAGMKLLALIQKTFSVQLTLKDLFTSPTVAGLTQLIEGAERKTAESIVPAAVQETYPVSSPQKRMFVLQQLEGAETSYNMPSVLRLKGKLDAEKLKFVMKQLTERHEAFRTTFDIKDGETVQRIWAEADIDMEYYEASEEDAGQIIQSFIRPFRLDQLPLVRTGLVKLAEHDHLLLFDMHHIISDGASVGVLIDELSRLYGGETLEPPRIHYKDYAVWQQKFIQSEQYRKQEEHWLRELDGELPVLTLPADYSRPAVQTFEGDKLVFSLTEEQTSALRSLAKQTDSTMYMVLLASYSAFLSKLSGQHDIIVGSPVAGRSHADLANVIGVFVNTLALRSYPEADKTFTDYLEEVKQTALRAFDAQDYPLEDLLQKIEVQRDTSRNPLFDAVFSMQNANAEDLVMEGIELKHHPFDRKTAKFDLTMTADDTDGGLTFVLEYNTALFKPETAETWKHYWLHLLEAAAENPAAKLSELSLVNETEKQALLDAWKGKTISVPRDKTVHRLFEETAARHANRPAAAYNGAKWTYGELNARANRIARILMDCGVTADERVGILTKPSLEMAAGVLGVLKAGAAFVPIDPDY
ncbi:surfactin non-ribosomal peptide synthetase SrfAA, partial [Bacillus sp. CIS52]